jgi:hypothetical protein
MNAILAKTKLQRTKQLHSRTEQGREEQTFTLISIAAHIK